MNFFCDSCGQSLEVGDEYAGHQINCPSCSSEVQIPDCPPAVSDQELENAIHKTIKAETESGAAGLTINQFMAERGMSGGVEIEEVLTGDQNLKYHFGKVIAKGGMGAILQASDLNIRRNVAMKVLLDPDAATRGDLLRFIEEAQVTGQLEHPSVVPVHDLGIDGAGNIFYTMKLVKGENLHAILKKIANNDSKTIEEYSLNRLLNIFQKVCEAMAFSHSKDVIHRDLKPENVMIGEFGEVLVMDWGLAKVLGQSAADPYAGKETIDSVRSQDINGALATISGTIFGTPQFMAPEQALGETAAMNQRTDIYSLGAILYNIVALRPPVEGKTVGEVLTKVTKGEILPPTTYNSQKETSRNNAGTGDSPVIKLQHCPGQKIPPALGSIAMKAMAQEQDNRYQSVADLADDIEAFQGGFATSAEQAGALKLMALFIQRNRLATISALIISTLGLGFFAKTISSERAIRSVSVAAAPKFVEEARLALEGGRAEEANQAITTAIGLNRQSSEAWFEKARLEFDSYDFEAALRSLEKANYRAENDSTREKIKTFRDLIQKWDEQITKDGKGVLPDHLFAMAPEVGAIDGPLGARLFSRVGNQQEALKLRVTNMMANLLKVNPGAEFIQGEGDWPMGIPNFYWHHVFRETGMELNPGKFLVDGKKLVNATPLAELPFRVLELQETGVSDLTPLARMPSLRSLNISHTPILSLEGLAGSKVEYLWFHNTRIADLSPLRGLLLKSINFDHTRVTQLSPLQGMPLQKLTVGSTDVTDLKPIRGMPLTYLDLHGAEKLKSIEPIHGMRLEHLDMRQCGQIDDVSIIRNMPLKNLWLGTPLIKDFSALTNKKFDSLFIEAETQDLRFLETCKIGALYIYSDHLESLEGIQYQRGLKLLEISGRYRGNIALKNLNLLEGLPIEDIRLSNLAPTDLSILGALPLKQVTLQSIKTTNLNGLRGSTRLVDLSLEGGFTDISGIKGIATLQQVNLDRCPDLKDIRPIMTLPRLDRLVLPRGAIDIEFLRGKPGLKYLGYKSPVSAEDFWRDHDAKR